MTVGGLKSLGASKGRCQGCPACRRPSTLARTAAGKGKVEAEKSESWASNTEIASGEKNWETTSTDSPAGHERMSDKEQGGEDVRYCQGANRNSKEGLVKGRELI